MNIEYIKKILRNPNTLKRLIPILLSKPKPFKFLISKLLVVSGISEKLKIQRNNYQLRFYPTALSAQLWVSPKDRIEDELFFKRYLKPGNNVIDLGANIGTLTIVSSIIVGNNGRVYSIEAHPKIYQYLLGNIELNNFLKNIETYNYAVGEDTKIVVFTDDNSDDQNQVSTNGKGISVPMIRLDELPIEDLNIDLLKIDVEGYEKFVFEGGSNILSRTQCIYFESNEKHFTKFGYHTSDIIALLKKQGFNCFKIAKNSTISPLPNNYTSIGNENLIAVKDINIFITKTNYVLD